MIKRGEDEASWRREREWSKIVRESDGRKKKKINKELEKKRKCRNVDTQKI